MLNPDNLAITLGRAVEVFRARPDAVPEHKTALRVLVALSKLGAATVRLTGDTVAVDGTRVPGALPGVRVLAQQMDAHGIEAIAIARNAAPVDLLALLRALAVSLGGYQDGAGVSERLRGAGTVSVTAVDPEVPVGNEIADASSPPPASPPHPRHSLDPLEAALHRLDAEFAGPQVLDRASEAGAVIAQAFEAGRVHHAVAALARLVRLEAGLEESTARRSLGIVLKRALVPAIVEQVADTLFVPARRADALAVLGRGGSASIEVLIVRLRAADTLHERRTYFDALRELGDALKEVLHLLDHHEWHVVRNVAELVGEAQVEDAIPRLARLLQHPEPRVRRVAAVALARIGTPATAEPLRRALRESDSEIRSLVAGAVDGRKSGALAMSIALAAEEENDAELQRQYYRALGRIGTPDALQALIKAVQPGGRFIGRRSAAPRIAAIDGLRIAAGPVAVGTLEGLTNDPDRQVRDAAWLALDRMGAV